MDTFDLDEGCATCVDCGKPVYKNTPHWRDDWLYVHNACRRNPGRRYSSHDVTPDSNWSERQK